MLDNYKKYINEIVEVVIDRPIGYNHKDMIYKINYGYIPNTIAEDNEEIDIYILDEQKPIKRCIAKVIAVIQRFDDIENKLVGVCDFNKNYTDKQIEELTSFTEKYFKTKIIR